VVVNVQRFEISFMSFVKKKTRFCVQEEKKTCRKIANVVSRIRSEQKDSTDQKRMNEEEENVLNKKESVCVSSRSTFLCTDIFVHAYVGVARYIWWWWSTHKNTFLIIISFLMCMYVHAYVKKKCATLGFFSCHVIYVAQRKLHI